MYYITKHGKSEWNLSAKYILKLHGLTKYRMIDVQKCLAEKHKCV